MIDSLRAKILVVAGTVLVATVLAVTLSAARSFSRAHAVALTERSEAVSHEVATQFERILSVGLRPDEIVGFEDQCNAAVARHDGIDIVAVLGLDGQPLFRSGAADPPLALPMLADGIAGGRSQRVELPLGGLRYALVVTPVFGSGRMVVGGVLVGTSQQRIERSLQALYLQVLAVGAGFIVMGLGALYFALTRFVTRPLVGVIDAINDLRRRPPDEHRPLAVAAQGEAAVVVETINSLLAQQTHHLQQITQAKELAESASRAKTAFLANMSHELRTPLNGILGLTFLARRRAVDDQQREQLGKVEDASHHLLALINDILDISRIEAERLSIEHVEFELGPVLDNLVAIVGLRARAKGLALEIRIDEGLRRRRFVGDPLRIGQVLLNLAGNAIKFTERGSVVVQARLGPSRGPRETLRLDVTDTGIGIAPEHHSRLFAPFEQGDPSLSRAHGGVGLGLAISRRLVALMGGEIGLVSETGQGSTFWVELPLGHAAPPATASADPVPADADAEQTLRERFAGARVLLVEDEPVNRMAMRELLLNAGLAVDEAEDGPQALALARRHDHSLVLMDLQLPRTSGLEVARALRADPRLARVPIVAVTANAFDTDRQACLAAGMDDHLGKPVVPQRLYAKVLDWLSRG